MGYSALLTYPSSTAFRFRFSFHLHLHLHFRFNSYNFPVRVSSPITQQYIPRLADMKNMIFIQVIIITKKKKPPSTTVKP
jgi:hypothetical protein